MKLLSATIRVHQIAEGMGVIVIAVNIISNMSTSPEKNRVQEKIKDSLLNPLPKNVREFKRFWLREQYISYSDDQILWLMKKLIKEQGKSITIDRVTFKV